MPPAHLLAMVTVDAAATIRQPQLGRVAVGAPADLLVIPGVAAEPGQALVATARRDVELVTIGGRPILAHPGLAGIFNGRRTRSRPIHVDGAPKVADAALARRIDDCSIVEPGVAAR